MRTKATQNSMLSQIVVGTCCALCIAVERGLMGIKTLVLLTICAISLNVQAQSAGNSSNDAVNVLVDEMADVSHIEFDGREIWDYKLKKESETSVSVEIDTLSDKAIVQLQTFKSSHVSKVEIVPGSDLKHKVIFHLTEKLVKSFDYITDEPSRLVIDFYKDAPKVVKKEAKKKKPQKVTKLPKKKTRAPAGTDFLAQEKSKEQEVAPSVLDGADPEYKRFKIQDYEINDSAIIASKLNLYIRYPMLRVDSSDFAHLLSEPNVYEIEEGSSDENKKARLLLSLFNKGQLDADGKQKVAQPRNAVFLKALELFRKEYPNSVYNEQLNFMEADVYFNLWLKEKNIADFDLAMSLYSKILLSVKNSKFHQRTQRLLGYAYMERKDYSTAFTHFQKYTKTYLDSPYVYRVKFAMAEALANLNSISDAYKIYDDIENDPKGGVHSVEAAFRKGDLHAINDKYKDAIAEYERAIKKYSKEAKDYPSAHYNLAESKFWLPRTRETLKDSLNGYIDFLVNYPKNPHSSYAMERIGETLEILGAPEKRYNGAFLETIYRYRDSPAAGIATIRMLRGRIPTIKKKDVDDEIAKINEFIKDSDLKYLPEFKTIMISDGYFAAKNYEEALGNLVTFYQSNPLSNYLDVLKKRIVQTVKEQISHSVDQKDYLKAFQIYGQNAGSWLKGTDRIDTDYLLGLAFERSGVPEEAEKKYRNVLNKLYSLKGTPEEKERAVFEKLPTTDEVNLRLAAVYNFKNEYGKAQDHLKEVSDKNLSSDEDKVEKVYLASIIYEKLNNTPFAMKNLIELTKTWRGSPSKLAPVYLRLAKLQAGSKEQKKAMSTLDTLINMANDTAGVSDEDYMQALRTKAELAEETKDTKGAEEAYAQLLDKFEEKYPLYSARYQLGKIKFDSGEIKEAEKVWSPLQDKAEAQLWSKLAQENLKNANWKSEYKKYTNRIPAMVNDRDANQSKEGTKK